MTHYEYVLRSWDAKDPAFLEGKYGWSLYTACQVYKAVKAKLPLQDVYRTDPETLGAGGVVQRIAVKLEQEYLAALKRVEGLQ